jgi:hypothetical protein
MDCHVEMLGNKKPRYFRKGEVVYGVVDSNANDDETVDIHLSDDNWLLYIPISAIDEFP